jgi:hypothetical protein
VAAKIIREGKIAGWPTLRGFRRVGTSMIAPKDFEVELRAPGFYSEEIKLIGAAVAEVF